MATIYQHSRDYPYPPWRLKGQALVRLQTLPIDVAQVWVPSPLKVVPVSRGRTLAALYLARYQAGSTLEYHELIVAPALVRHGARIGAWISHIYVDSEASVAGGREIWSLPKQLAQFHWRGGGLSKQVEVKQGEQLLCSLHTAQGKRSMSMPLYAPVLSSAHEELFSFHGKGHSAVAAGTGELLVPPGSPFAPLGLSSGRIWALDQLDLTMAAPGLGRRL